jgi:CRISPR/Cas system-associated exonuclease Cas4 (RecB family)
MEPFLKLVAADLYQKLEGDLSRTAIVFPNKRAGLFFNEYLAAQSDRPLWAPSYISISELYRSLSDWETGDSVQLVCDLYKVFVENTHSKETLDEFFYWGELLIADFDDIDKNMVHAEKLFSNLQALKDLEGLDFLTKEQEEAIQQFFVNFSLEKTTELKQRFISLWSVLGDIYQQYKELLASKGIAYEGMLYREACNHLKEHTWEYDHYVFVGFNVLNRVEQTLFNHLKECGKALFYWDYDTAYLKVSNQEANEFIRRNLRDFPSELPESCFDNYSKPKEITFVEATTENIQARFIPSWLRENLTEKESETAVVLCNEALLQPVFHSLPDDTVKHVNITMGFPLTQTPVFSFIRALIDLQTSGFNEEKGRYAYEQVAAVLNHSYTHKLSAITVELMQELTEKNRFFPVPSELQRDEMLTFLFTPCRGNLALCSYLEEALHRVAKLYQKEEDEEKNELFDPLYQESIFRAYQVMGRFKLLIEEGDLQVMPDTFTRLLTRVLSGTSIPFHGEPAIGLQVMGVLETRNLDFKHLAILSLNEGKLPKSTSDSSFIPYNLRRAFGMTLPELKNAVYAYYFYRLIQRAEKIALLYNSTTDGLNRGEMSRFMLQLLVESPHHITKQFITARQNPQQGESITVEKTPEVMQRLCRRFDGSKYHRLSPTALNTYLGCPLKFYFHYVAGLKPKEEVTTEIDSATFGSIFHRTAELIYIDLTAHNKVINQEELDALRKDKVRLERYVDNAFKELFFKVPMEEVAEYNGVQLINSEVIILYLQRLLALDSQHAPFTMEGMEQQVEELFQVEVNGTLVPVCIGGTIDRMDAKDGVLRIIDYKTGGRPGPVESIETLFTPSDKRPGYIFQTFLYASLMTHAQSLPVMPTLLYIHCSAHDDYSPAILMGGRNEKEEVRDFTPHDAEFRARLQQLLQEIYQPELPFQQTECESHCAFCDYRELCKK